MSVRKCEFCGRLYEERPYSNCCPKCESAAKRNDFPGTTVPPTSKKRFVEGDGFFDEKEFIQEQKGSFFESSDFHPTK